MKSNRPRSPEAAAAILVSQLRNELDNRTRERDQLSSRLANTGILSAAVREMGQRWLSKTVPSRLEAKGIDDPNLWPFPSGPDFSDAVVAPPAATFGTGEAVVI